MSLTENVIEGTLKPDGTLVLDQKPSLSPGRVTVVLRQEPETIMPPDDPFWQRMRAIWAIPKGQTGAGDGGANALAEVRKLREELDEHQLAIERLQDECRPGKEPKP
jgi:hypothetical protein